MCASPAAADNRRLPLIMAVADLEDIREDLIVDAVDAALAEETAHVDASLMLAIAWGESRLDPLVKTGRVCGSMQTVAESAGQCKDLSSHVKSYRSGARELETLLKDRRVHGSIRRALLYYACGNSAFTGRCPKSSWPAWVLSRANTLRKRSVTIFRSNDRS